MKKLLTTLLMLAAATTMTMGQSGPQGRAIRATQVILSTNVTYGVISTNLLQNAMEDLDQGITDVDTIDTNGLGIVTGPTVQDAVDQLDSALDDLETTVLSNNTNLQAQITGVDQISTNGLVYVTGTNVQEAIGNLDLALQNSAYGNTLWMSVYFTNAVTNGLSLGSDAYVGVSSNSASISGDAVMTNAFSSASGVFTMPYSGVYSVNISAGGVFQTAANNGLCVQAAWAQGSPPYSASNIGRYGSSVSITSTNVLYVFAEGERIMRFTAGDKIASGWYIQGSLGATKYFSERYLSIVYLRDL